MSSLPASAASTVPKLFTPSVEARCVPVVGLAAGEEDNSALGLPTEPKLIPAEIAENRDQLRICLGNVRQCHEDIGLPRPPMFIGLAVVADSDDVALGPAAAEALAPTARRLDLRECCGRAALGAEVDFPADALIDSLLALGKGACPRWGVPLGEAAVELVAD